MAIQFGSLRHTASGRKRRPLPKSKTYTPDFKPLEPSSAYRRDTKEYSSARATGMAPIIDDSYKIEESKKFTIAPAYNKGAYQVISRENVRDIGK